MMNDSTHLTIISTKIRQDDAGRYCLNDCHRASQLGADKRPSKWLVTEQAKALIAELKVSPNSGLPLNIVKTGDNLQRGTYAAKELVYAYAMWISPTFHLTVIRAFDNLVQGNIQATSPETLMARALQLADKTIKDHKAQLEVALPKATAFDELANTEGLFTLRDSAKLCGWPEKLFIQKLIQSPVKWLYVHSSSGRKLAYAGPIKAGYMDVKQVTVFHKTTGRETYGQPMITQKGLTKLAAQLGIFAPKKESAHA